MRSPARHLGSDAEKLTPELTATITQQRWSVAGDSSRSTVKPQCR